MKLQFSKTNKINITEKLYVYKYISQRRLHEKILTVLYTVRTIKVFGRKQKQDMKKICFQIGIIAFTRHISSPTIHVQVL